MLEGAGNFDRADATGRLALNSSAASLGRITGLIAPFAPQLAARLDALGASPGPARLKLALDLDKNAQHADRASARAVLDLDAPQLKGVATVTAKPEIAAIRAIDLDKLRRSEIGIESKLSSEQGRPLLALLGLDRAIAAGDGPAQFEGSVDRRVARAAAAESQDLGSRPRCRSAGHRGALGAGAQGQRQSQGSPRQSRAAVRSQAVRHAGAEHQPVVARVAGGQQADLRRSRQRDSGFAAARAPGADARRGKRGRGRSRPRRARSRAGICAGDRQPPGAMRPSRSVPGC